MPIKACQGCLKDMFLTTTEAIDCFTGKELWLWGNEFAGQLGTNFSSGIRSSPVQTISTGSTWKSVSLGGIVSVFAGYGRGAGIKSDGTLWTWGVGAHGALGTNDRINRSSPVQTVSGGTNWKQVSVGGGSFMLAIKTDGTLWGWGLTQVGQLGIEANISRSSPVQTVSGGTNWNQVSAGTYTGNAIKTDGTLWTWGFAQDGALGTGNIISRSSPVQTVSGGTNWKQVSGGVCASAAVKTDGTLWLWGRNIDGQLGDGTRINRSSPVQTVSGGTNWKQVSMGGGSAAAIKTDGTLWLWGRGEWGGLGTNNTISRSSPVQTISGGTNWRCVETSNAGFYGSRQAIAIKTDGTLWTWGSPGLGSLGNNNSLDRSSPVQTVSGGTGWKTVSANAYMMAAIKETEF